MSSQNSTSIMIGDIQREYVQYREGGKNREEAVELLRANYREEMQDSEERLAVLIGISLALCKKKELYESIAAETLCAILHAKEENTLYALRDAYVSKVTERLKDQSVYGREAMYKRKVPYVPDWKIGDTFSHELTCPRSEKLGIKGWLVLLHKVAEYIDDAGAHRQLMYVSVCPPDKVPSCGQELQKLGFLPMMYMGERREYFAQIKIKSRRKEKEFNLTKIGCFYNVEPPKDQAEENPLTTRPLFEFTRKGESWSTYEDDVCSVYRDYIKRQRR